MARAARRQRTALPPFPLRPSRPAFSKRTRFRLMIAMLLGFVLAIAAAVVLLGSSNPPLREVTIPKADRDASPALIRAAEAVDFHPLTAAGTGKIEDEPASFAQPPITSGLLPVGSKAPAFTARTPTGHVVRLSDLKGKAVLLDFFTTWCPHCAAEAPHMQKLFASVNPKRTAFVAVDANGEDAPSVYAYHVYYGLGFPAVLDPSVHAVTFPNHGKPGPITKSYHVGAYPTFYVLDRTGRIVWRSDGEQPDALIRRELRAAAAQ
jgi:thiol-disulfide isomerase/thioredoxin